MTVPVGTWQAWIISTERHDTVTIPFSTESEARQAVTAWMGGAELPENATVTTDNAWITAVNIVLRTPGRPDSDMPVADEPVPYTGPRTVGGTS